VTTRSHIASLFHLDKCIGCHTCSVACKNLWTDRDGAEYMWFNNVETKPGTGYPTQWEDQEERKGGWVKKDDKLELKSGSKLKLLSEIFHDPNMPSMDDYYEPFEHQYEKLFNAPLGTDQPTSRPVSKITGEYINVESGPNWDDDLGGSSIYASNDINLDSVTPKEREQLQSLEKMALFYLPRICNHCLNPSCVAACPSGAMYKRGEDGIVLVDQEMCRGWRKCIPACPYKKIYFNWETGKSEKCILCYPRIETGQAPACFHSCVGRIRYLGVVLYDSDLMEETAKSDDCDLVEAQRKMILNPFDPEVIEKAKRDGVGDDTIKAAQKSPVYKYVKEWKIALPLHPEYRTLAMLFYVPPLLPSMGKVSSDKLYDVSDKEFFTSLESARVPLEYMASLFSAGNISLVEYALKKELAVKVYRRSLEVKDVSAETVDAVLKDADCSREEAEEIYRLTSLAHYDQRFVIPPAHREMALEGKGESPQCHKGSCGFGCLGSTKRGP
jgi:nitrate reductase beta subunit